MLDIDLYTSRQAEVFRLASEVIRENSTSLELENLLMFFLNGKQKEFSEDYVLSVSIPYGIYTSIKGSNDNAGYLAVSCLLLYLSADIIDDIADGDFVRFWGESVSPSEGVLASLTLSSSIAPLALDWLKIDAQLLSSIKSSLSKFIIKCSAGQLGDLAIKNKLESTSAEDIISILQGKSGYQIAGMCSISAQLAGLDESLQSEYSSIGCLIGTTCEIIQECHELYNVNEGRDLVNQKPTLPLAFHFEKLSADDQIEFLKLLDQARSDEAARVKVRKLVSESGALKQVYDFVKKSRISVLTRLQKLPQSDNSSTNELSLLINELLTFDA